MALKAPLDPRVGLTGSEVQYRDADADPARPGWTCAPGVNIQTWLHSHLARWAEGSGALLPAAAGIVAEGQGCLVAPLLLLACLPTCQPGGATRCAPQWEEARSRCGGGSRRPAVPASASLPKGLQGRLALVVVDAHPPRIPAACLTAGSPQSKGLPSCTPPVCRDTRGKEAWSGWALYSDEPPAPGSAATASVIRGPDPGRTGACKGVVLWNKTTMGWLVHSVPRWPPAEGFLAGGALPALPMEHERGAMGQVGGGPGQQGGCRGREAVRQVCCWTAGNNSQG